MKTFKQKLNFFANHSDAMDLFIISFVSLFFEIIFIRWIPSIVHVVGFFSNITLIACFLGLSAGCILAYKKVNMLHGFPLILLITVALTVYLGGFWVETLKEDYVFEYVAQPHKLGLTSMLIVIFVFITILFVPLGQELGRKMNKLKPLVAYAINLTGSILGVIFSTLILFFSLPPIVWFAIGIFFILWFFRKNYFSLIINVAIAVMVLGILYPKDSSEIWSPYSRINIAPLGEKLENKLGYALSVNGQYHQFLLDFDNPLLDRTALHFWKKLYSIPYYFGNIDDVLILGAGAGNDAAIALGNNAKHIDAVEIDPKIIEIGKKLHPEKPYSNNKVTTYTTDARSFLKNTDKKYDLITLGTLDSHSLFSSMSTLRLDNYVYTIESFEEIRKHLKDNGLVAVLMGTPRPWIANRMYQLLENVFQFSSVYYTENSWDIVCFLGSMNPVNPIDAPQWMKKINTKAFEEPVPLSADNWPYFYMVNKTIPSTYLKVLFLILIFSGILIFLSTPKHAKGFNFHFFFLGSAFMLLETKSITEIALLFGSTWIVNSVVIGAILVMCLAATLYIHKFKAPKINLWYALLICTIIFDYLFPLNKIFIQNFVLRMVFSGLIVALPMVFASIIFAQSFKTVKNAYVGLGSNLFGAVIGGVCEYSSLIYGLKNLYIVALVMYLASWFFCKTRQETSSVIKL